MDEDFEKYLKKLNAGQGFIFIGQTSGKVNIAYDHAVPKELEEELIEKLKKITSDIEKYNIYMRVKIDLVEK